jgi:hypothetical protein
MLEHSEEANCLRVEIGELQSELALCQATAEAQNQTIKEERLELAEEKAELQNDNTAANCCQDGIQIYVR